MFQKTIYVHPQEEEALKRILDHARVNYVHGWKFTKNGKMPFFKITGQAKMPFTFDFPSNVEARKDLVYAPARPY